MKLNIITAAKGGIGKTFLCFLYFLDSYFNEDDRKYIFIDHNFINRDLFHIFRGLHQFLENRMTANKIETNIGDMKWYTIKKDKILFIWNNDDHYFPEGIAESISLLSQILTSKEVINFLGDTQSENVEVFVDTNLHIKNFYLSTDERRKKLKDSFEELNKIIDELRIIFIWNFSLLLDLASSERLAIKKAIDFILDNFETKYKKWENVLLSDKEKKLNRDIDQKPEYLLWSVNNLYHVLNYYIPFDEPFRIRRKRTLRQLETFYERKKSTSEGISFNYISNMIEDIIVDKNFPKPDKTDLNLRKAKILEKLREKLCDTRDKEKIRPQNILIIPTFDAKFSGFTEKMADLSYDTKVKDLKDDTSRELMNSEKFSDICRILYSDDSFNNIIKEIKLKEEN